MIYPKEVTNVWKRASYHRIRVKNPLRHKARRLKMSLTTMKIERAWSLDELHDMICRPIQCPYCEKIIPFNEISVDHIQPRSDGGLADISNIQLTCLRCNQLKGGLNDRDYRRFLFIAKQFPDLIVLYEKRIRPSLAYFNKKRVKFYVS